MRQAAWHSGQRIRGIRLILISIPSTKSTRDCDEDADAVATGIEFVRKMTGRSASLFTEIIPGRQIRTRPELAQFVKDCAWGHHACGTCKMGADDDVQMPYLLTAGLR